MTTTRTTEDAGTAVSWIAAALTAGGTVTFALFPFAIPMLVLTAAFAAPLVILPLVLALPVGLIAGVVLAIRATVRRLRRLRPAPSQPPSAAPRASQARVSGA